jgi:hypothetical protein
LPRTTNPTFDTTQRRVNVNDRLYLNQSNTLVFFGHHVGDYGGRKKDKQEREQYHPISVFKNLPIVYGLLSRFALIGIMHSEI